jgi:hypothetical protein
MPGELQKHAHHPVFQPGFLAVRRDYQPLLRQHGESFEAESPGKQRLCSVDEVVSGTLVHPAKITNPSLLVILLALSPPAPLA